MSNLRKLTCYIGRFSLWHNGHAEVALAALRKSKKVLIIIGSTKQPRTTKNPWTVLERAEMISRWYDVVRADPSLGELVIETSRDYPYNNNLWLGETQKIIGRHIPANLAEPIWITGSDRDSSTFYLSMFPRPTYELDLIEENEKVSKFLSATWCREIYIGREFNGSMVTEGMFEALLKAFIPRTTLEYLTLFEKSDILAIKNDPSQGLAYQYLTEARRVQKGRQKGVTDIKHPRIDVAVDNMVVQSGHILLVKRKSHPGKGLWALPGGYLEPTEWTIDGSYRELNEETAIKVPPKVIRNSIKADHWYEHPDRSEINRIITHCFAYELPDFKVNGQATLPKVSSAGDPDSGTEKSQWFPIADVLEMSDVMFDDHHAIVEDMLVHMRNDKGQS